MEKEINFEKALEKLEKIINELENGSIELDNAIKKYTEAMELVKFCNEKLTSATDSINKIMGENGIISDFEIEEE